MVKRLVTLESCGSPTCPFSNPDTLDQAFTEITAEECSNTAAFYAPTTPSTDRDREEEFRAAMGFNQTPGPVEKLDKLEKMENSMNNYISSNAGEGIWFHYFFSKGFLFRLPSPTFPLLPGRRTF